jgi:hypothetical protein
MMRCPANFISRYFLMMVLVLGGCALSGGQLTVYQVPSQVLAAFKAAYPAAAEPEYRQQMKQGVRVYTVEFLDNGVPLEVDYTFDGRPYRKRTFTGLKSRADSEDKDASEKQDSEKPDDEPAAE